jgi:hypothetical protein
VIIGSNIQLKIGASHVGILDGDEIWRRQPFTVIREVAKSDWQAYCRSMGKEPVQNNPNERAWFYEVATD